MKTGRAITGSVLLALMLAACGPAEAPEPVDPADLALDEARAAEEAALASCGEATAEGYCGVRFGAAVQDAVKTLPVKLEGYEAREGSDLSPDRCYELFPVPPVSGVSFLVERGVVGRIDVINETVRMGDDVGVGTEAQALRTRFGDALQSQPNTIEPEITDLSLMQGATKFVFEIQDGSVRAWRAGMAPTIDYVAHCG